MTLRRNPVTLKSLEQMCGFSISQEEYDETSQVVNRFLDEIDLAAASEELPEPMYHGIDVVNVMAEDEIGEELSQEEALKNAPKSDGESFLVPNVLH